MGSNPIEPALVYMFMIVFLGKFFFMGLLYIMLHCLNGKSFLKNYENAENHLMILVKILKILKKK